MRAALMFRPNRHYRAMEFGHGLARHGFSVSTSASPSPTPDDLLVLWNRTRAFERTAAAYERAGARVLVAENGYLDRINGEKHYALALGHHNGAGRWFVGDQPRFEIEQQPIGQGDAILILPQRGIGEPGVAMPADWPRQIRERIGRLTKRPVIVRRHPGMHHPSRHTPLEQDLARAHAVVTWASGAAIKAIRAGLPCFYELDGWIANCAATRLADQLEQCESIDSGELWRRVSWGQWTMADLESGEAFDRLLHEKDRSLFCARQSPVSQHRQGDGRGYQALRR